MELLLLPKENKHQQYFTINCHAQQRKFNIGVEYQYYHDDDDDHYSPHVMLAVGLIKPSCFVEVSKKPGCAL